MLNKPFNLQHLDCFERMSLKKPKIKVYAKSTELMKYFIKLVFFFFFVHLTFIYSWFCHTGTQKFQKPNQNQTTHIESEMLDQRSDILLWQQMLPSCP